LITCLDHLFASAFAAIGKLRPTAEELKTMSPEFDHRWETFFAKHPDKPVIIAFTGAW